jgi:hypothetical protein
VHVSKQGLIQLQKRQNEVIPVVEHVDTTFFRQNGDSPHTGDILHDVFGSYIL